MPIISAGDVTGAVAFLDDGKGMEISDSQKSLIQAASQFFGTAAGGMTLRTSSA